MIADTVREWILVLFGLVTAAATAMSAYFAFMGRRPIIQCSIRRGLYGDYQINIAVTNNQRHKIIGRKLAVTSPHGCKLLNADQRIEIAPGHEQQFQYQLNLPDEAALPVAVKLRFSITDRLLRERVRTYTIRRTINA